MIECNSLPDGLTDSEGEFQIFIGMYLQHALVLSYYIYVQTYINIPIFFIVFLAMICHDRAPYIAINAIDPWTGSCQSIHVH